MRLRSSTVRMRRSSHNQHKRRRLQLHPSHRAAGRRILLWYRQRTRLRPMNQEDPITLEPPSPPVYKHIDSNGSVTAFDATCLAAYFECSGNFVHPTSRQPFYRADVWRLERVLGRGLGSSRLLSEFEALKVRRMMMLRRDCMMEWLTSEVTLVAEEMIDEADFDLRQGHSQIESMFIINSHMFPMLETAVDNYCKVAGFDAGAELMASRISHIESRMVSSIYNHSLLVLCCLLMSRLQEACVEFARRTRVEAAVNDIASRMGATQLEFNSSMQGIEARRAEFAARRDADEADMRAADVQEQMEAEIEEAELDAEMRVEIEAAEEALGAEMRAAIEAMD